MKYPLKRWLSIRWDKQRPLRPFVSPPRHPDHRLDPQPSRPAHAHLILAHPPPPPTPARATYADPNANANGRSGMVDGEHIARHQLVLTLEEVAPLLHHLGFTRASATPLRNPLPHPPLQPLPHRYPSPFSWISSIRWSQRQGYKSRPIKQLSFSRLTDFTNTLEKCNFFIKILY